MENAWIPDWAGVIWTVIFGVALAVHLRHVLIVAGRARLWHGVHVLMTLGMIDMYWPTGDMLVGPRPAEIVYGVAATGLVALIAVDAIRRGRSVWLWSIAAVDMAVMVYMFLLTSVNHLAAVTVLLAVWSVSEALGWAFGFLATAAPFGDKVTVRAFDAPSSDAATPVSPATPAGPAAPAEPHAVLASPTSPATPPATSPGLAPAAGPASGTVVATAATVPPTVTARPVHTPLSRLTLTLMNVGMAYMLLAMQFGIETGGMPGMPGM